MNDNIDIIFKRYSKLVKNMVYIDISIIDTSHCKKKREKKLYELKYKNKM